MFSLATKEYTYKIQKIRIHTNIRMTNKNRNEKIKIFPKRYG